MTPSKDCFDLIKESESCELTAYLDPIGIPTIGWGHISGVKLGDVITQEQADEWLVEDVGTAARAVTKYVKVSMTQGQFDALVDFTFNLDAGSLYRSTLLRKFHAGRIEDAAGEFDKWIYAKGKVLPGLVTRRAKEKELFLT